MNNRSDLKMWQNLASFKEVKEKKMLRVELDKMAVLLIFQDDSVYALNDKCPHLGASLAKGSLNDGVLTCAAHHTKIDIKTGDIVDNAKILFIKFKVKNATVYPVKVDGDKVMVEV
jgi:3-phenylpropionate/trans-cinnamate dioxygenase ferredoxin component